MPMTQEEMEQAHESFLRAIVALLTIGTLIGIVHIAISGGVGGIVVAGAICAWVAYSVYRHGWRAWLGAE